MRTVIACCIAAFVCTATDGAPAIDAGASIVAVVTHRGGFASGLAHDHLIALPTGAVAIEIDPDEPLATRLTIDEPVEALIVDDAALRAQWSERLVALELIDRPLGEIDAKSIGKIRAAMLGRKQLDAASHPRLSASISEVRRQDDESFPFAATVTLGVHGTSASRSMRARLERESGRLIVEAIGAFEFSALGIKPYSAMLGAVRNQDRFHVYVYLVLEEDDP